MRSPIEFEKDHHYDRCRESIDSEEGYPTHSAFNADNDEEALTQSHQEEDAASKEAPPPYSAFSLNRRRFILGVVTLVGCYGPLTGAVYLPSLELFQKIFNSSATVINATVSVYMIVFAVVPLFGAMASDIGGRKLVYMIGLGSFLVANILLAVLPPNIGLLFILRIFQALGSCIVFSVGAGTVADIVEPAKRASALAIFLLGVQLAPAFGPLIGSLFVAESRWRWIFGSLALTCFPVYLAILFCVPETLRSLVGNGAALANQPWFSIPKLRTKPCADVKGPKVPRPSFRKFMRLLKYPPHLIVSFNGAFQFAGLYSMYVSFPRIWTKVYRWSTVEVGYAYLVPGISMFIASIVVGRVSDFMRKKAVAKSPDGKISPESRIAYQIPGFVISGAGKFMLGWFCHNRAHPVFPLLGSALAAVGTSIVFVTSTSFQTECDPTQTASLVAVGGFLRNVAAALAAVSMEGLVNGAGYGWTFSIFGLMDVLCIPGILLIMFKGADMRAALKAQQAQG